MTPPLPLPLDGAAWRCAFIVPAPTPVWWTECHAAAAALVPVGARYEPRCSSHLDPA